MWIDWKSHVLHIPCVSFLHWIKYSTVVDIKSSVTIFSNNPYQNQTTKLKLLNLNQFYFLTIGFLCRSSLSWRHLLSTDPVCDGATFCDVFVQHFVEHRHKVVVFVTFDVFWSAGNVEVFGALQKKQNLFVYDKKYKHGSALWSGGLIPHVPGHQGTRVQNLVEAKISQLWFSMWCCCEMVTDILAYSDLKYVDGVASKWVDGIVA